MALLLGLPLLLFRYHSKKRAPGASPADSSPTLPSERMNAHQNPGTKIFLVTVHSAPSSLFHGLLGKRSFQKGITLKAFTEKGPF